MLDYNITNLFNLPSDNNKEYISPGALNNYEKKNRPADTDNKKEDIKLADIDKQRSVILN